MIVIHFVGCVGLGCSAFEVRHVVILVARDDKKPAIVHGDGLVAWETKSDSPRSMGNFEVRTTGCLRSETSSALPRAN